MNSPEFSTRELQHIAKILLLERRGEREKATSTAAAASSACV
jgi:hypothetical protein